MPLKIISSNGSKRYIYNGYPCEVTKLNKKCQKMLFYEDVMQNNKLNVQALNYQDCRYLNPDYSAKVLGLKKEGNYYIGKCVMGSGSGHECGFFPWNRIDYEYKVYDVYKFSWDGEKFVQVGKVVRTEKERYNEHKADCDGDCPANYTSGIEYIKGFRHIRFDK